MINWSIFPKKLRYWSIHAIFCATPSFIMAVQLGYFRMASIAGMLAAIASFILLYTFITSSNLYDRVIEGRSSLRTIVHRAAVLRSVVSAVGILGFANQFTFFLFYPDFIAGIYSIGLSELIFRRVLGIRLPSIGSPNSSDFEFFMGNQAAFIPTYITTIFEGVIISVTLLLLILLFVVIHSILRRANRWH